FGAGDRSQEGSTAARARPPENSLKENGMLQRALILLFGAATALSLTACGGKSDEDTLLENETTTTTATNTTAAPAGAPPAAPAAAPATGGATVTGKVAFDGTAPPMPQIKMDADAYCKGEHKEPVYEQEVVVNPNKTLQWVLVYVKEGVTG